MKTKIFYYTGTGNSLWIANALGRRLENSAIVSMVNSGALSADTSQNVVGIVFPVHMWGLPPKVLQFVKSLKRLNPGYIFAVAVNAGQVANTLIQLKRVLEKEGLTLNSGFEVKMPSNYIPWGGPGPQKKQNDRFSQAQQKVAQIAFCINNRERRPVEKGPVLTSAIYSLIYKMSFSHLATMDRQFWVDEKCIQCGICGKVCTASNITFQSGIPNWNHHCEQCFACLQWCPQEAIQYGKKTSRYQRYHQPEIKLQDMLKSFDSKGNSR